VPDGASPGGFGEDLVDALQSVGPVTGKRMFGGLGFYLDGLFFALLFRERLYFKVDERNRGDYEARGMEPFRPPRGKSSLAYYEVPLEVLEDRRALKAWAAKSIEAARTSGGKKKLEPARLALGPVARGRLAEVGIRTRADLERIGSVAAFRRIREAHPRAPVDLLYALEGALLGLRWNQLPDAVERNLRERAGITEPPRQTKRKIGRRTER
jgi:DNA transformation protein